MNPNENNPNQQYETNQNQERGFLLVFVVLCCTAFILSFLLPAHWAMVLCRGVIGFLAVTYALGAWWLFRD
jgi:hypothetical protein